ncbi:hypothetical protein G4G27_02325 [Sphingomonas sp. So64.6b]|uniref:hypothetical protein n=1 Tax=Sphingomonas sp. So64.6b TaxID=2997354 RepID=UPI0015FF3928|nr:hypothetical protein [Sphingomonas sp. So64.6b]QNA82979.1 hypothetical protein G4G27_02325 [Sphingomonas sp. So64.6b]
MRKIIKAFFLVSALAQTPAAYASTATLRLVARVPVMCAVDFNGARMEANRIVISVHRMCNTSHIVAVSVPANDAGDVRVSYANTPVLAGGTIDLVQPERYFDDFDEITVESQSGDSDQLLAIAQNINVAVYPS